MRAANLDWQLHVHGGAEHSFTYPHPPTPQGAPTGVGHHPRHAARAWAEMLVLLDETIR